MYARPKLTDSVSVSELMTMRESGLTNAEIAKRLDVTPAAIYKYIGKQPPEISKPRGYAAVMAKREAEALAAQRKEEAESRKQAEEAWTKQLAEALSEQEKAEAVTVDEDENLDIFGVDELPDKKPSESWTDGLKVISRITHAESAGYRYTVDAGADNVKIANKLTNAVECMTLAELKARIDELTAVYRLAEGGV